MEHALLITNASGLSTKSAFLISEKALKLYCKPQADYNNDIKNNE